MIYLQAARTTLRNVCRTYDEVIVHQLGRAALLDETELVTFLVLRLREKHDEDVQIEQTQPFSELTAVPDTIHEAAATYKDHESPATPYSEFISGTDHPSAAEMQRYEL